MASDPSAFVVPGDAVAEASPPEPVRGPSVPHPAGEGKPRYRIVLEPGRAERHYWRDLWKYRELLLFLAWRDIAVHYKQTVIGVAWAVIRPVSTMVVFSLIFGRL